MIHLSQRNLLTLLYDLEARGIRYLHKPNVGTIVVETDDQHYHGGECGQVPIEIEAFITKMKAAIRRIEQQVISDQNPPEWALTAARVIAGDFANSPEVIAIAHVISKCAREAGAW